MSELIYQRAFRTLKASLPSDPRQALDAQAFGRQRDQVLALQALLRESGGTFLGERLVATLDGEVLPRLSALQDDWRQQPLQDARALDFASWQGEPLALARGLGAEEPAAGSPSFRATATHLDLLVQQARALLSLGSPGLPTDPAALRWRQLRAELERYAVRAPDSSLLRLERYVAALGPDLRRDNCGERLAGHAPAAAHEDDIGLRHLQLHRALTPRCSDLRLQAPAAAGLPQ